MSAMRELKEGDYVLATKWNDGDPGDQFAIGFYTGMLPKMGGDRYMVADNDGKQFRRNGFRRIAKISHNRGVFLCSNIEEISISPRSVWWWKQCKMESHAVPQAKL